MPDCGAWIREPGCARASHRQVVVFASPHIAATLPASESTRREISHVLRHGHGRAPAGSHGLTVNMCGMGRQWQIAIIPGDGIGPEIMKVGKAVLDKAGALEGLTFEYTDAPIGGQAIDLTGVPLPDSSVAICKASDACLMSSIGGCGSTPHRLAPHTTAHMPHAPWLACVSSPRPLSVASAAGCPRRYKWDTLPGHLRPEAGLLGLRAALKVFANLRPASILPQLVDASTLKREVVEGVDIMVVRELTGGIYFGEPKVRRLCPPTAPECTGPRCRLGGEGRRLTEIPVDLIAGHRGA